MSQHTATISWKDTGTQFMEGRFSRAHSWTFDGGLTVPASSSPSVVRPPLSDPAAEFRYRGIWTTEAPT